MSLIWPILKHAVLGPTRTAVIDDRRRLSYAQLAVGGFHLAQSIDAASTQSRIGIMLPTSGAFAVTLLGAWLAGRIPVPLNYLLSKRELAHVIGDSGIDTIFTAGPMLDYLGGPDAVPGHVCLVRLESLDLTGVPELRMPPGYRPDHPAVILYTSGTSGLPKGVVLTQRNLRTNIAACLRHAQITKRDTLLGVLPQFHSFGLTALTLMPLTAGARVVFTARFIPKKLVELMREHRPTVFMAVPSMYGALLSVKDAGPEDFRSLRFAVSGGEPLPRSVFDAFRERFSLTLLEGYGLTETAPVTNWSTPTRHKVGAVGPPIPGVHNIIVGEHDQPLGPDQEGEIVIAGPNVMQGYLNLPDKTEEVMLRVTTPDGQTARGFRTGDIGRTDADGFLYITGRKQEMLIIGGENVFPREIEEVLNQHPTIAASGVVGKADDVRGEVPIAFVELAEGAELDAQAVRAFCREHLAPYKCPREIHVVDTLPRNPTGKILRRELRPD